jgi:hypothetical protein
MDRWPSAEAKDGRFDTLAAVIREFDRISLFVLGGL